MRHRHRIHVMDRAAASGRMQPVPWFLATAPSTGPELVPRPRIDAALDHAIAAHRAVLVSAPSGFGKTVAVAQWAARTRRTDPASVSWLTLTDLVAEPGDLVRGILTALQQTARESDDAPLHRSVSAMFDSTSSMQALAALAQIDSPHPITVVVDEFQNARSAVAGSAFDALIENGPAWLRTILLTTDAVDPAFTRLRVHGALTVIGSADLALNTDEVVEAAHRLRRPVDHQDAEQLRAATGGWPVAVRLALAGGNQAPTADVDLTDYISSSVLARLRPELADFVLCATTCRRLDDALAGKLTGRPDAAEMLRECVSNGLFVERFSSAEGSVFQWHSIFAEHCQRIIREQDPQRWRTLNRVVAHDLATSYPLVAVDHAISAGDGELATEILTSQWLALLLQSRPKALDHACSSCVSAFGESGELLLIRACCRALVGDRVGTDVLFARSQESGESTSPRIQFIADLTEVLVSDDEDAMATAADRAQRMLSDPDVVSPTAYACALYILGWANSRLRRGEIGYTAMESAIHECTALGLTELAERARQNLAFALAAAGQFTRTLTLLNRPDRSGDVVPDLWPAHDGGGVERFAEGYVHFWRGELEHAREAFRETHSAIGSGFPDIARTMLALTIACLDDRAGVDAAAAALDRMPDVDSHGVPWTSYQLTARAGLAELQGSHGEALELVAQLVGRDHLPMMSAIGSGICLRLGATELAGQLARAAKDDAAQPYSRAYAHLALALLAHRRGAGGEAHGHLETCLGAAAPEGVLLPFIDLAGPECAELLAGHSARTGYSDFLDRALLACDRTSRVRPPQADALTPRERQVLSYLRRQMTSGEIATQMAVSVNTVKTHQRAIYRKLGVGNRREAVRLVRD